MSQLPFCICLTTRQKESHTTWKMFLGELQLRGPLERFRGWQSALALVSSEIWIAHLYGEDNSNAPSHSVVCDAARKKVGSHLKQKRETPQARKRETKKPRNQEARKTRNRETKKLRNQENQKPRDPKPKKPRNLETGNHGALQNEHNPTLQNDLCLGLQNDPRSSKWSEHGVNPL